MLKTITSRQKSQLDRLLADQKQRAFILMNGPGPMAAENVLNDFVRKFRARFHYRLNREVAWIALAKARERPTPVTQVSVPVQNGNGNDPKGKSRTGKSGFHNRTNHLVCAGVGGGR